MQPRYEQSPRDGINHLAVELDPLRFLLVDPHPELELGQIFGILVMWLEPGSWIRINHISFPAVEGCDFRQAEVISVGNLMYELSFLLPVFVLLVQPFLPLLLSLVSAFHDD